MMPVTLATNHSLPFGVAVDTTQVYWVDEGAPNRVMKVGRDGEGETILVANPGPSTLGVAADATHVYWADKAVVHRVAKDGTGATALALPSWGSVAVDAQAVYAGAQGGVFKVLK